MDIILIRHGESLGNKKGCFAGPDTELSEKGRKEALESREAVVHLKTKKTFTSPYKRAVDTMELLGLHGEVEEDLHEVDFGIFQGLSYGQCEEKYPDLVKEWNENPFSFKIPEGESLIEAYKRVSAYLERLIAEDEDVVLVCHEGVIRLALSFVFDQVEYFYRFKSDNLGLSKISINDGYKYIDYQNRIFY